MLRNLRALILVCALGGMSYASNAQENRMIDGSRNNISHADWGSINSNFIRKSGNGYGDLISTPGGQNRPNPRTISNSICSTESPVMDEKDLSTFTWVFGQFIDHDITFSSNNSEFANIPVPLGDASFDPFNTGTQIIAMNRSVASENTGTSQSNPRNHVNEITAYIDGSGVYGSTDESAAWLRTFEGGKMKTSNNGHLPYNTVDGSYSSSLDHNAPEMDDAVQAVEKIFVAGDVRANENALLTAMHTLFLREHNRLADQYAVSNPSWNDEQIYQHVRKIVGGKISSILYNEWLPTMGVQLDEYSGYDASINPQLYNVFPAAAYRLGHSLVNSDIQRVSADGTVRSPLPLRNAFFYPPSFIESGMDDLFRGMAVQVQQKFDGILVEDIRNFLFGLPGSGGLDLAAININRGRERGVADYNTVRASFGLPKVQSFSEITANTELSGKLEELYGSVDDIDAWIGLICEDHMDGIIYGETVTAIMKEQFTNSRDGDRFFYLNDPALSEEEKSEIHKTRMVDVILENTNVTLMQGNVFRMMDREQLADCDADEPLLELKGSVTNSKDQAIESVNMSLKGNDYESRIISDDNGTFDYGRMPACYDYSMSASKEDAYKNGVTTLDIVKIQRHILGIEPFDSPFKWVAADVTGDKAVRTSDLVSIRRLILEFIPSFPNVNSWKFIPSDYDFEQDEYLKNLPDSFAIKTMNTEMDIKFIGVKMGDVSGDASISNFIKADERGGESVKLNVSIKDLEDDVKELVLSAEDYVSLKGGQFTLTFDNANLEVLNVEALGDLTEQNYTYSEEKKALLTSWNGDMNEANMFKITVRTKATEINKFISINDRIVKTEAYDANDNIYNIDLVYEGEVIEKSNDFNMFITGANPFDEATTISYYLPGNSAVTIEVISQDGKTVISRQLDNQVGNNRFYINGINNTGVYIVKLTSDFGVKTESLIKI